MGSLKFEVYKNLHKDVWSIRHNGRVVNHADSVIIMKAQLVVQPSGRERVLRERRKNVHAFIRGEVILINDSTQGTALEFNVPITYNPYKQAYFYRKDTGEKVDRADFVLLNEQGAWICAEV